MTTLKKELKDIEKIKLALAKKNKNKRDKYVELHPDYDKNHIYLVNGKSHIKLGYESVTSFIKKFFEEFDSKKIIEKYYDLWQKNEHSKYFGKSKEEIKLSWENYGKQCRDDGTKLHELFEINANNDVIIEDIKIKIEKLEEQKLKSTPKEIEKINIKIIKFRRKIEKHKIIQKTMNARFEESSSFIKWYKGEVSNPIRTEYTVYGEEELVIGNVDFIYSNKNGELCIVDYKRLDLPNENSYDKKCVGIDLPDTKKSKHLLQLNIYKYLLEKYYGLEIKHLYNLYIKENTYNFVEQKIIDLKTIF